MLSSLFMGRGRKRRGGSGGGSGSAESSPGRFSNRPFAGLELPGPAEDSSPDAGERPPAPERERPFAEADGEDEAFAELTAGVEPLDDPHGAARPRVAPRPAPAEADEAYLVMRQLDELVYGNAPFDFADTDEQIEAAVQGLDRRVLRRLRRGDFSVQRHVDLHGLKRDEAREAVARFVREARRDGLRCVLIVHGRGRGSKDNIPVLKEKLRAWLTRGAIGKHVLAYTSARPWDGGTGAVYVLLRA
ncbi:MAG: Smr/MutS family protein [Polyangia bacterium]